MCNPILFAVAFAANSYMESAEQNRQIEAANRAQKEAYARNELALRAGFLNFTAQKRAQLQQRAQAGAQQLNKVGTEALEAAAAVEGAGEVKGRAPQSMLNIVASPYLKLGKVEAAIAEQRDMDVAAYHSTSAAKAFSVKTQIQNMWRPEQDGLSGMQIFARAALAGAQGYLGAKGAGIGETAKVTETASAFSDPNMSLFTDFSGVSV